MNRRRRSEAFLYGVGGGSLVVVTGSLVLLFSRHDLLFDLIWFGTSILVGPVAAAFAAAARGAAAAQVLTLAGLAFLLAFFIVNVVDYGLALLLFVPYGPGPFQGKTEMPAGDVDTITARWLLGRHLVLCVLGILGGSALGMWRGGAAIRRTQIVE
jgi:hypothetical protein